MFSICQAAKKYRTKAFHLWKLVANGVLPLNRGWGYMSQKQGLQKTVAV